MVAVVATGCCGRRRCCALSSKVGGRLRDRRKTRSPRRDHRPTPLSLVAVAAQLAPEFQDAERCSPGYRSAWARRVPSWAAAPSRLALCRSSAICARREHQQQLQKHQSPATPAPPPPDDSAAAFWEALEADDTGRLPVPKPSSPRTARFAPSRSAAARAARRALLPRLGRRGGARPHQIRRRRSRRHLAARTAGRASRTARRSRLGRACSPCSPRARDPRAEVGDGRANRRTHRCGRWTRGSRHGDAFEATSKSVGAATAAPPG